MSTKEIHLHDSTAQFKRLLKESGAVSIFESPLPYDGPVLTKHGDDDLLKRAQRQALLDWNRQHTVYHIEDKSLGTLTDGQTFDEDFESLSKFLHEALGAGVPSLDQSSFMDQLVLHIHQSGFLHLLGIATSKHFLQGHHKPSPTFKTTIHLYPIEGGIGIVERLDLKEIMMPSLKLINVTDNPLHALSISHFGQLTLQSGKLQPQSLKTTFECSDATRHLLDIKDYVTSEHSTESWLSASLRIASSIVAAPLNALLSPQPPFLSNTEQCQQDKILKLCDAQLNSLPASIKQLSSKRVMLEASHILKHQQVMNDMQVSISEILAPKPLDDRLHLFLKNINDFQKTTRNYAKALKKYSDKPSAELTTYQEALLKTRQRFIDRIKVLQGHTLTDVSLEDKKTTQLKALAVQYKKIDALITQINSCLQVDKRDLESSPGSAILPKHVEQGHQLLDQHDHLESIFKTYQQKLEQLANDMLAFNEQHSSHTSALSNITKVTNRAQLQLETITASKAELTELLPKISSDSEFSDYQVKKSSVIGQIDKVITELEALKFEELSDNIEAQQTVLTKLQQQFSDVKNLRHELDESLNTFSKVISDHQTQINDELALICNPETLKAPLATFQHELLESAELEAAVLDSLKKEAQVQLTIYQGWYVFTMWSRNHLKEATALSTSIKEATSIADLQQQVLDAQTSATTEGEYLKVLRDIAAKIAPCLPQVELSGALTTASPF